MTDLDQGTYWSEYLTTARRLWGADALFLARHADRYRVALARAHRRRAHWLIKEGRTREARADLRAAGDAPALDRLLAALPGRAIPVPLVRSLRRLRRQLHRQGVGSVLAPATAAR